MHKGKIKLYRGVFGYIISPDFRHTLYFTKADIRKGGRPWLKRGDEVEFIAFPDPERKGRYKAHSVLYTGFTPFTFEKLGITPKVEDLVIGHLSTWNGMKGVITSSMLQKKDTFLYYSRVINVEVKQGQTLVFKPVDSKDSRSTYFAYFAYPIEREEKANLLYIYSHDGQNGYPELELYIKTHFHEDWLFQQIKWMAEDQWTLIDKLCNEYVSSYGKFSPEKMEQLPKAFQVYAWERKYTDYLNEDLLLEYFIKSSKDGKEYIISRMDGDKKHTLIDSYCDWFVTHQKYYQINSHLKPLISLLRWHRNEKLAFIHGVIFDKLNADVLIDLWISGYIDHLPKDVDALNHILNSSVEDFNTFLQNASKNEFNIQLYKDLELRLLQETDSSLNNDKIVKITLFLKHRYDINKSTYTLEVLPELEKRFSIKTLRVFTGLGVHTELKLINIREKEKTILDLDIVTIILLIVDHKWEIDVTTAILDEPIAHRILRDMCAYAWSDDFHPAYFLQNQYKKWFNDHHGGAPRPEELATELFIQLQPSNSVHHIRLYIAFFAQLGNSNVYYDFLKAFKKLKKSEKTEFRDILKSLMEKEEKEKQKEIVEPCTDSKEIRKDEFLYHATISNIYFSDGGLQLRMKNGDYTEVKSEELVSSAFNMIGAKTDLGKIPLLVTVRAKTILSIDGLDEIIAAIHKKYTQAVLAKLSRSPLLTEESPVAYVQDFDLKKSILAYLESQQIPESAPVLVYEYGMPIARQKSINGKSSASQSTLSKLFSIKYNDHILIIWENIGLDETLSTYIFKTPFTLYSAQLKKIETAVSSYRNLRTYLTNNFINVQNRDEKLERQAEWRQYLGYLGNIKKRRGVKDAFSRWEKKLEEIAQMPCPDVENIAEPAIVETEIFLHAEIRKSPKSSKSTSTSRDAKVQKMDDTTFQEDNFGDDDVPVSPKPNIDLKTAHFDYIVLIEKPDETLQWTKIYDSLQMLNQNFLQNI